MTKSLMLSVFFRPLLCLLRLMVISLRRFAGKTAIGRRAATAVEYALVAPIFFLLLFGIFEFGLYMHIASLVENATHEAARLGATGNTYKNLNPDNLSRPEFLRKVIFDRLGPWINDPTQVVITTSILGDHTQFGNARFDEDQPINAGDGSSAILYRVTYKYDIRFPLGGEFLGEDGILPITSTVPIVNEEFCGRRSCF